MEIRKPEIIEKVWGYEEIMVRNDKYCGKRLHLNEGYESSNHRHPKSETFYIESGLVYLELENSRGKIETAFLEPKDIIDIGFNQWHKFSGLENSIIIETSTPDVESERRTQSRQIPNFEKWKQAKLFKFYQNLK